MQSSSRGIGYSCKCNGIALHLQLSLREENVRIPDLSLYRICNNQIYNYIRCTNAKANWINLGIWVHEKTESWKAAKWANMEVWQQVGPELKVGAPGPVLMSITIPIPSSKSNTNNESNSNISINTNTDTNTRLIPTNLGPVSYPVLVLPQLRLA